MSALSYGNVLLQYELGSSAAIAYFFTLVAAACSYFLSDIEGASSLSVGLGLVAALIGAFAVGTTLLMTTL